MFNSVFFSFFVPTDRPTDRLTNIPVSVSRDGKGNKHVIGMALYTSGQGRDAKFDLVNTVYKRSGKFNSCRCMRLGWDPSLGHNDLFYTKRYSRLLIVSIRERFI